MNKTLIKILILVFIMMVGIIPMKSVYAATSSDAVIVNSTYIVPYGSEVSISSSGNGAIASNNTNIAKVNGNKLQIVGVGNFTVSVKSDSTTKKIKFFAWNAFLKKGVYYTYNDAKRSSKTKVLYSQVYLAVENTSNNKAFLIKDYIFKTGKYSGTLKGKYITSYYNSSTNKSTTKYWEYSFNKNSNSTQDANATNNSNNNTKKNTSGTINKLSINSNATKTYTYNGATYIIPKVSLSSVLSKIGKQTPDACLTYASKYANQIFSSSGNRKITSYKMLGSQDKKAILKVVAQELSQGRPVITRVNGKTHKGTKYSRHFVTIVGIKKNADMNNLKETDFLILDPSGAKIKQFGKDRFMLKRELDLYHSTKGTKGYLIMIYNNQSVYLSNKIYVGKLS